MASNHRKYVTSLPRVGLSHKMYYFQNMTSGEFLNYNQSNFKDSPHYYLYYFGNLDAWPNLIQDAYPVIPLYLKNSESDYSSSTNLFIGHSGVIAQTHYDRSHNFFVQVYGKKRFLLAPPSEWKTLYLYPHLHPHYQQSAVDWDSPNLTEFPEFQKTNLYEANLEPGDLLYIPRKFLFF